MSAFWLGFVWGFFVAPAVGFATAALLSLRASLRDMPFAHCAQVVPFVPRSDRS
jgi:hypothetical protein